MMRAKEIRQTYIVVIIDIIVFIINIDPLAKAKCIK